MLDVKIGGVPEHFNLPWYLKLKDGSFKSQGINLRWQDFYGGTGSMCSALRANEIDIAVILTEGIVTDIINGNPSKIVQNYIASPLIWGIHVSDQSSYRNINDLKGKKAAISRYGSGSHLMAYVNAQSLKWDLESDLDFEIVNNLDGGINALSNGEADYFLWELFTTKPFVDKGILRRIDNCPTPWPCFVIAATDNFISNASEALRTILAVINSCTSSFKTLSGINQIIADRYNQKIEDVNLWLSLTEWSQKLPEKTLISKVQNQLQELNIIETQMGYSELVQMI